MDPEHWMGARAVVGLRVGGGGGRRRGVYISIRLRCGQVAILSSVEMMSP